MMMESDDPASSLPSYPALPPSLGTTEGPNMDSSSSSALVHFDPYASMSVDVAADTARVGPLIVTQSSDETAPPVPPRSPLSHPSPPSPPTSPIVPLQQTSYHNSVQLPQEGVPGAEVASTVAQSSLDAGRQTLRLQYVEHLCGNLQREKKHLEESFGRQRKQFMNRMTQNDAELQLAKHSVERFSNDVQELSRQLAEKDAELENVVAATRLSANSTQEMFDADRVKYEEEIASLRQIMEVKRRDQGEALQLEREAWNRDKQRLLGELQYLRNSFGRQSPYGGQQPQIPYGGQPPQIPYGGQPQTYPRQPPQTHDGPPPQSSHTDQPQTSSASTPTTPQEGPYQGASKLTLNIPHPTDSLETSMKKAVQDSELLRAIVVPYEEEIDILKVQLCEATEKLKELENKVPELPPRSPPPSVALIDLETPLPATDSLQSPLEITQAQLQHQLDCEQAARHDLEMHTRSLENQKATMKDEMQSLKEQLEQVRTDFEKGKLVYDDLKNTWDLANQHFIVAQDQLKNEVYRLQQKLAHYSNASPDPSEQDGVKVEQKSRTLPRQRQPSHSSDATLPVMPRSASWSSLTNALLVKEGEESVVDKLENELAKVREDLARRIARCDSYENQLQRVQEQMVEEMDDKERAVDRLKAENAKVKAAIMRERTLRQDLSQQFENTREEMQTRIETFRTAERELTQQLKSLKTVFPKVKQNVQKDVSRFAAERTSVYKQAETYREEYDCLKVVQVAEMNEYWIKVAEIEQKQQEAECNLEMTMHQLETVQEQASQTQDSLSDELVQVKEELIIARREGERTSSELSELTADLQATKKERDELQLLKQKEQQAKDEALTTKQSIQEKSRSFIAQQQEQMELLGKAKDSAEEQVRHLQRQLSSLKLQLNTTEANQKDFVQLSQSLQVRLAEMEDEKRRASREGTPT